MRAAGVEPAQALRPYGFSYHFGFHRRLQAFVVWTIPSPWRVCAVGAARLVSTPSLAKTPSRSLGKSLARDCHLTGFPEFEQFCIGGFPRSTQVSFKSVASTSFATPALLPSITKRVKGEKQFIIMIIVWSLGAFAGEVELG